MKKLLLTFLAAAAVFPVKAQLFTPESLTGAGLGAIAGAVIGHNSGRHGGEGAAIGAGIGLLAGSLVHQSRDRHDYGYSPSVRVSGHFGYNSGHHYRHSGHYGHHRSYGHYGHYGRHYGPRFGGSYYSEPTYYSTPTYIQPVATPVYIEQPVWQQAAAPAPQPQNVTIINNYYNSSTPMTGANSLFGR